MMSVAASAIVRAKNEARMIERTFSALREQTVAVEIIVVDSGSEDGTVEIAKRWCDRLIQIPQERFSYGRALNLGAREASAAVHVALSAHCAPERSDWVERALAHYVRDDVAGAYGNRRDPHGAPLASTFLQDAAHARRHPWWGFSNHASSWRASVWERFHFDEDLDYAEDKEWALRVQEAGFLIAFDPALWVDISHMWRRGARQYYTRQRRSARAMGTFTPLPAYGITDLVREWWHGTEAHPATVRSRLSYLRAMGLLGRYHGHRDLPSFPPRSR